MIIRTTIFISAFINLQTSPCCAASTSSSDDQLHDISPTLPHIPTGNSQLDGFDTADEYAEAFYHLNTGTKHKARKPNPQRHSEQPPQKKGRRHSKVDNTPRPDMFYSPPKTLKESELQEKLTDAKVQKIQTIHANAHQAIESGLPDPQRNATDPTPQELNVAGLILQLTPEASREGAKAALCVVFSETLAEAILQAILNGNSAR